jgi:hypothetical protein
MLTIQKPVIAIQHRNLTHGSIQQLLPCSLSRVFQALVEPVAKVGTPDYDRLTNRVLKLWAKIPSYLKR